MKHILRPAWGALLAMGMTLCVSAQEPDILCFSPEQFTSGDAALNGICITSLPPASQGTLLLGQRQLRPGDVLTAQQVEEMTFAAVSSEDDSTATISYLPVFSNGLAGEATMTLSLRGKENQAPVAVDCAFETYKNLELTQMLKVHDPEEQAMEFTVVRAPQRGTVQIDADGKFTYTPKKNKVGTDSFTFIATDISGKASREATVTINILKPTDAREYSDTAGKDCRFAAEWMKHSGIFVGENIGGSPCFSPEKQVTRGEFVTMLVKALELPTDESITQTGYEDVPQWLQPYLAAAIRSGLTSGIDVTEHFHPDQAISAQDAAAMLCSALNLEATDQAALSTQDSTPLTALEIALQNGFPIEGDILTRGDAACIVYQANQFGSQTN